jgi:HSP20 family molecular chaperone IbpA
MRSIYEYDFEDWNFDEVFDEVFSFLKGTKSTETKNSATKQGTEDDNNYYYTFVFPGISQTDINVNYSGTDNKLTVEITKESAYTSKNKYQIYLPTNINPTASTSKLVNGVLTITVPKKEEEKVEIKVTIE